ncbi:hypothetical protein HDU89_004497 [Geranomyces variabilis]|nr:hypothetical protein HDU89_004497 [Geranomyces variabilis]
MPAKRFEVADEPEAEDAEVVEEAEVVEGAQVAEDAVEVENAGTQHQEASNNKEEETKADRILLSKAVLLEKFQAIKSFASKADFIFEKANVSAWVRPEGVADILLLHDILIVSLTYETTSSAAGNRPNISMRSRLATREKRTMAEFRDAVRNAVNDFYNVYRTTANFTKAWKATIVDQDEDTHVHATLHTMMEEVFNNEHIITVCSRAHRATYHNKGQGKKPDSRVLSESFEELFIETKSHTVSDDPSAAIYDLYQVALFLQGSVIAKFKVGVSSAQAYGLHLLRETLEVYMMTLEFDGLYTLHHLASFKLPRRADDLELLMKLIAVPLNVKENMLANLRKEAAYDSDDWVCTCPRPSNPQTGKLVLARMESAHFLAWAWL